MRSERAATEASLIDRTVDRTLSRVRSREALIVAGLAAAAAALRLATIDVQSYWFDEAVTVDLLRMPFGDMISRLPDTEITPTLYYVLSWPWLMLFGYTYLALRSLSKLYGVGEVSC